VVIVCVARGSKGVSLATEGGWVIAACVLEGRMERGGTPFVELGFMGAGSAVLVFTRLAEATVAWALLVLERGSGGEEEDLAGRTCRPSLTH
jgi:hypothetical protein